MSRRAVPVDKVLGRSPEQIETLLFFRVTLQTLPITAVNPAQGEVQQSAAGNVPDELPAPAPRPI